MQDLPCVKKSGGRVHDDLYKITNLGDLVQVGTVIRNPARLHDGGCACGVADFAVRGGETAPTMHQAAAVAAATAIAFVVAAAVMICLTNHKSVRT